MPPGTAVVALAYFPSLASSASFSIVLSLGKLRCDFNPPLFILRLRAFKTRELAGDIAGECGQQCLLCPGLPTPIETHGVYPFN